MLEFWNDFIEDYIVVWGICFYHIQSDWLDIWNGVELQLKDMYARGQCYSSIISNLGNRVLFYFQTMEIDPLTLHF